MKIWVEKAHDKCTYCDYNICFAYKMLGNKHVCGIEQRDISEYSYNFSKPDWCPLRELPKKKEDSLINNPYAMGRVAGWNACLDEIMGEKYEVRD